MDFLGPLPSGEELMVLVDEYSRFPIVEIIRSVSANTVIPVLGRLDLTTFFSYLSKITSNLPEIYLSKSKITR